MRELRARPGSEGAPRCASAAPPWLRSRAAWCWRLGRWRWSWRCGTPDRPAAGVGGGGGVVASPPVETDGGRDSRPFGDPAREARDVERALGLEQATPVPAQATPEAAATPVPAQPTPTAPATRETPATPEARATAEPQAIPEPQASAVRVTPPSLELGALGSTGRVSATVLDGDGDAMPAQAVSWRSANGNVARVNAQGVVTAVGAGTTTLTATAGPVSGRVTVVVPVPFTPGTVFRDCASCPEMVVLDDGTFLMGSPDTENGRSDNEGPRRNVTVQRPFAIGVHEVTFDEWQACVDGGGCGDRVPDAPGSGRGRRPIINVSWDHARSYTEWLSETTGQSYRLPSEAEWEYAARGGTTTARYWGTLSQCDRANGYDMMGAVAHEFAWSSASCSDSYPSSAPVGSYPANPFGIHDMLGNVWEWTQDCWNNSHANAPQTTVPREDGVCAARVLRGGSWYNDAASLRAAHRTASAISYMSTNLGFRVVRTLP